MTLAVRAEIIAVDSEYKIFKDQGKDFEDA
jgi:hypothetical protein